MRSATEWNDPDFIRPDEAIVQPQRKSTYQHLLDSCLGRPYVAAKFLHLDNFDPAPRPSGRAGWGPPSEGVRRRIAQDAALRASPVGQQILSQLAKEERADFFDRLRARLGKPTTAAEAPRPKQPGQPHTITSDGDNSTAAYFERLRGMLGGK
jgi:hypothetical protein